ncbi:MAG: RNA recognition motif domain-containing protein [Bacteroidota bacterium]|jgi:RNA recognition motif-containing protein|nr:RNA-binding protein [Sphingobacteriales bacterium]
MDIYVGNLNWKASDNELKDLFSRYGEVTKVNIVKDKMTRRSKGYGFVEFASDSDANNAINELNGKEFMGRNLVVNQAKPRQERSENSGGY